jgi:RNA polymerase sigma-70 factor (ECF subfamily)
VDAAVVDGFRAGDPDAVREVYRRYSGAVQTVARATIGADDELCADVVQQTFVKAWRAAANFDPDRELAPWLYAIARRTAVDALRAERRPTRGDHAPETDVAVTDRSFEQTYEAHQVRDALDRLPPDEREVMRLSHFIGLSHSDIAERLGVPVGTIKSRTHRAHKRLASSLSALMPESARPPGSTATTNRPAPSNVERGELR